MKKGPAQGRPFIGPRSCGSGGDSLDLYAPLLMHLHPLVGRQLAVVIGVGLVEMLERGAGHFIHRHFAVVIGVGHLEHLPVHAHGRRARRGL